MEHREQLCEKANRLFYQDKFSRLHDQKQLYNSANSMLHRNKSRVLSTADSAKSLAVKFNLYFKEKIQAIHQGLVLVDRLSEVVDLDVPHLPPSSSSFPSLLASNSGWGRLSPSEIFSKILWAWPYSH